MKPSRPHWRSKRAVGLAIFFLLLALSHAWRAFFATPGTPLPGQEIIVLPELTVGEAPASTLLRPIRETGRSVELAYRDLAAARPDAPVLVLLHGSPMASRSMDGLIPHLEDRFRLIVPDLPGFGGSTLAIANYSTRVHAAYLDRLLEHLEIEEAVLVAYSQAGGVALNLTDLAPEKVAGIVMLSAIGVIEEELLGRHDLNRALYSLQLGGLAFLQEGFPHFGWMDDRMLNVSYARNFFDTDMRPFRDLLRAYEGPMLILHGHHDPLVPVTAAREHARIVPQSELILLEGGHGILFREPAVLAPPIASFAQSIMEGTATTRARATPERLSAAADSYVRSMRLQGLALGVVMLLLAVATLISEDLACVGAGILASQGLLLFSQAALAVGAGIFFGDLALYAIGRMFGPRSLRNSPLRFLTGGRNLDRFAIWLRRRGVWLIAASRFVPGSRVPLYLAAGMVRMPWWKFAGVMFLAIVAWVPVIVGLAYFLGGMMLEALSVYGVWALPATIVATILILLVLQVGLPLCTWRGRRLAQGRLRRWVSSEYWPTWLLYLPVVGMLLGRKLRGERVLAFTAVNPAIPLSGFVGESKAAILDGFHGDPRIAPYQLLPDNHALADWIKTVRDFQTHLAAPWPVVVKPDQGERGSGVTVVQEESQLRSALTSLRGDGLVQAFIPGEEFGLFYARHPDETSGRIIGVTRKTLPSVIGNGVHSVEHLLLAHPRHHAFARFFFSRLDAVERQRVPTEGEVVLLSPLGTHSRGALFEDAADLATPELVQALDELSQRHDGFCFGRYDVRSPSDDALRAGAFQVLECNGVTSEVTNLYDPRYHAVHRWHLLLEQWRLALLIGQANARRGAAVATLHELAAAWRRSRHRGQAVRPRESTVAPQSP